MTTGGFFWKGAYLHINKIFRKYPFFRAPDCKRNEKGMNNLIAIHRPGVVCSMYVPGCDFSLNSFRRAEMFPRITRGPSKW